MDVLSLPGKHSNHLAGISITCETDSLRKHASTCAGYSTLWVTCLADDDVGEAWKHPLAVANDMNKMLEESF